MFLRGNYYLGYVEAVLMPLGVPQARKQARVVKSEEEKGMLFPSSFIHYEQNRFNT
jgi:hypothetical protein